jgi:hypothetical protein
MPSTDRKLELKAKISVAQTASQAAVYAKGLTIILKRTYKGVSKLYNNNKQHVLYKSKIYLLFNSTHTSSQLHHFQFYYNGWPENERNLLKHTAFLIKLFKINTINFLLT